MLEMPDDKPPLFFDAVVLSNFAFADGGVYLLKKRYQNRGMITLQVIEEIKRAAFTDFEQLEFLDHQLIVDGSFQKVSLDETELSQYLNLLRNLGAGEASCIAAARYRKGIVVTDDRMARNFCRENHLPLTGTIGILKASQDDGLINMDTANRMLQQMVRKGFYSPVNKISDLA